MPLFHHKNCQMSYDTYGSEGDWVTLVNGHTRSKADFRLFAKKLVAGGFRVLTFDNRGAGDTTCEGDFTFEDMVSDIKALWGHLSIETSHLFGVSMGGWICQMLAAENSGFVKSLVLVSTSALVLKNNAQTSQFGQSADSIMDKLEPYFSKGYQEKNQLVIKAMVKQIGKLNEDGAFDAMALSQRAAIARLSLDGVQAKISMPTLVLHGDQDRIISLDHGKKLAEAIKTAQLEVFEGAGHLLLAEAALMVYQKAIGFFGANP